MFDILQMVGGFILVYACILQVGQMLRTGSTNDLNLKTYIATIIGISLMEIYAIDLVQKGSGFMFAITNSITLVLVIWITAIIIILRWEQKTSVQFRHSKCYQPNNDPYPLCVGRKCHRCTKCCLYEDMDQSYPNDGM